MGLRGDSMKKLAPAERLALLRIAIGAYATVYVLARFGELVASAQLGAATGADRGGQQKDKG